jgi:hypothetical protein
MVIRSAPLEKIVHECNVWIRGCTYNTICNFQNLGFGFFNDEYMEHLSDVPQAFLQAAPAAARAAMKTALAKYRPLMQELLTPEELATLVTAEDTAAEAAFRAAGSGGWADFFEGCGSFSPNDRVCSWVVWACDELEKALFHVAWNGASLQTLVPALLEPWEENDWAVSKRFIRRISLSQWLANHEHWIGKAVVDLFHRARAGVVVATLTSCLGRSPLESDMPCHLYKNGRVERSGMQTRRRRRLEELQRLGRVRDIVFAQEGLLEHIASFC